MLSHVFEAVRQGKAPNKILIKLGRLSLYQKVTFKLCPPPPWWFSHKLQIKQFPLNHTPLNSTSDRHTPWPVQRGSVHGRCDWSWHHLTAQLCQSGLQSPLCTSRSPPRTAAPSCREAERRHWFISLYLSHLLPLHCFYSLEQSLGLAGRIVRSEVLVLLHLLLYGEELTLQLGPQAWQGVPDVVGQLLCRSKVKVRSLGVLEFNLVLLENTGPMSGCALDTCEPFALRLTWLRTFWR